ATGQALGDPQRIAMQTRIMVRKPRSPDQPREREHRSERWLRVPQVSDRPLLWKEMHFPLSDLGIPIAALCCGYPLFLLLIGGVEQGSTGRETRLTQFLFWFVKADMMLLLAMATFRATTTFSQERAQQTIAALFTLPMSQGQILAQKGVGCVLRFRSFLI